MLNANELSYKPLRQGRADACLLSSYAAAIYPFTKINELNYFIDCCRLLNYTLVKPGDAVTLLKPQLIDNRIGTIGGSGYDWLEQLHNNCTGASFVNAKSLIKIDRTKTRTQIEEELHNARCSAIFALHFPTGATHSICIIKDQNLGYIARDSGQPVRVPEPVIDAFGQTLEELVLNLYNLNGIRIGESVLFYKK